MNEYQRIWIDGEEVYCKLDAWINADSDSIWDEDAMKDTMRKRRDAILEINPEVSPVWGGYGALSNDESTKEWRKARTGVLCVRTMKEQRFIGVQFERDSGR